MTEREEQHSAGRGFGRQVLAAVVLLIAAWLLFGIVIHFLGFLFYLILVVLAIAAVVWALRVLL